VLRPTSSNTQQLDTGNRILVGVNHQLGGLAEMLERHLKLLGVDANIDAHWSPLGAKGVPAFSVDGFDIECVPKK